MMDFTMPLMSVWMTFIVPAAVGKYTIRPLNEGENCATMKAYVRKEA